MSRRHDILGSWLAHRQISRTQYEAGRRFIRLFERSGLTGHATIDLQRPIVDGRRQSHGAADAAVVAKVELSALRTTLGAFDFALVCRVIGEGRDLTDTPKERERNYLAHRVRDALGIMATRFALEMEMA